MNFSKIQKITSSFVLFFFLFNLTFSVPFFSLIPNYAKATNSTFHNLVSIIVSEDVYSKIRNEVNAYAKDIQGVLENTRVIILPTPSNSTPFQIASLNESLYFDGYKGLENTDFESKLIGTVLIGNIPLPIVYDSGISSKTIVPYVDFEDKIYVYNHENKKYEKSSDSSSSLKAEVWHGVISPNTGDEERNIQYIENYFKKNHDFYTGKHKFKNEKGILNGEFDKNIPSNYEPYVFYFDQFRESKSLLYSKYKGYQGYLENKEDLVYNRFSKELAEKVKNKILGTQNEEMNGLLKGDILKFFEDNKIDLNKYSGPELDNTPDIQTRYVTKSSTNKFLEIFNSGTLGDLRKYVHNAGRYNLQGSRVNVDMIPFLISVLDLVSDEVIKNANNDLEKNIDDLVKNGLSRKIALPTSISNTNNCSITYTNFLYGMQASSINTASQCSIYRGSTYNDGQLVESNRGINIKNIQSDLDNCNKAHTNGYWGGNSPVNLNQDSLGDGNFILKSHDLDSAIIPIFDIAGSKEIYDNTKNPSPLDCLRNNYILTYDEDYEDNDCEISYRVPINGASAYNWSCKTNNRKYAFSRSFIENFSSFSLGSDSSGSDFLNSCRSKSIFLDGTSIRSLGYNYNNDCTKKYISKYYYKTIPSYIVHKSPTSSELSKQIENLITPSLPVDKDRYIDFIGADGSYGKINYPYLFRVNSENKLLEDIDKLIEETLDEKSSEINSLIDDLNPSKLSGIEKEIYENYLKIGNYPSYTVDLYKYLKDKSSKTYNLSGDSKEIDYYDTLVFAIYWNNLKSVSAKYKFIFENYLSDEFFGNDFNFHLPKNKKQYEIAYLSAPGDSENMYIKLDPEEKAPNPYADIISKNIDLNSKLFGSNLSSSKQKGSDFKCAPPEGVPIWEWIPAVICWLKDMLPPKIGISEGVCGVSLLSDEERERLLACSGDFNKNGIGDCTEIKLEGGKLDLKSDASKYYYNKQGVLEATIKDKDGKVVRFDNSTYISFELSKVEVPEDETKPFSGSNKKVIYDRINHTEESFREALKYINFSNLKIKSQAGVAKINFSTKHRDANVSFKSFIDIKDFTKETKIFLESEEVSIQIRDDRIFVNSSKIINSENGLEIDDFSSSVFASDKKNIFLIDEKNNNLKNISNTINNSSLSEEKLVLSLSNFSKFGNLEELSYPINLSLFKDSYQIGDNITLNSGDLTNFKSLFSLSESGNYIIKVKDSNGFLVSKNIVVNPLAPSKIDVRLGSTIGETGGNITTHAFLLLDKYNNPSTGNLYNIDLKIDGKGVIFEENDSKKLLLQTFEGYRVFRLKSTDKEDINKINFEVKKPSGDIILSSTADFRTLKTINFSVNPISNFKVGGESYEIDLTLSDYSSKVLGNFNSRVYVKIDPIYASIDGAYSEIKSGKARIELKTGNLAGKNIPLEFQVEGLNNIYKQNIEIVPEKPIKINLSLSRSKIEASSSDYSILNVELKDRYENLVYNDSTSNAFLEIPDEYKDIIKPDFEIKNIKGGKTQFKLYGTSIPGVAYFKVRMEPGLENNSFEIEGQSPFSKDKLDSLPDIYNNSKLTIIGRNFYEEFDSKNYKSKFSTLLSLEKNENYKKLSSQTREKIKSLWLDNNSITISGLSENAGKIETFYFWNSKNILGNSYNSIYTVLLGASYGDITQQDYLASHLLFDKDNRSLAVTSLLNNSYKYSDVLNLNESSGLTPIYKDTDLSQDIRFSTNLDSNGRLYVNIFNDSLSTFIGKVYPNFSDKTLLKSCPGTKTSLNDCSIPIDKTSIVLKSYDDDYLASKNNNKLVFQTKFGKNLFSVNSNGFITRQGSFIFELRKNSSKKYMIFDIKSGQKTIGTLIFNFVGAEISISRDENIIEKRLNSLDNSLIVFLESNLYGSRDAGDGKSKIIYYNDPFETKFSLDSFSKGNFNSFENFVKKPGVGWEEANKSLLGFAASKSVGEATKDYMSFSLINLGDPVLRLKNIKEKLPGTDIDRSFDRTIGKLISTDDNIVSYKIFDYNSDSKDDIILIKRDSYIKLLENIEGEQEFLDRGNLVHAVDLGDKQLVQVGDFSGDNYDDIFFVNKDGKPFLFNNYKKNFERVSLSEQFELNFRIVRAVSFDMDNDGKTDLVSLDESGQINIFYGGGSAESPLFTKLLVSKDHGLKLSSKPRNDNSAIYYESLPQLKEVGDNSLLLASSEEFLSNLNNGNISENDLENSSIIDRLIFVRLPYNLNKTKLAQTQEEKKSDIISSIDIPSSPETSSAVISSIEELKEFDKLNSSFINYSSSNTQDLQTTFIKSEYSNSSSISVSKVFTDRNGGNLKSGDIIQAIVTLKNETDSTVEKIAYVDDIENIFTLDRTSIKVLDREDATISSGISGYDFLVDSFSLKPGETLKIAYDLRVLPLKYSYLQVGLFEEGELGDDDFGDIFIKSDNKNCSINSTIYRSIDIRKYSKGIKSLSCDEDKLKLPGDLEENKTDSDGNGVPDYIDDLVNPDNNSSLEDFAQDSLNDINKDSDNDGIPDYDDDTSLYNSESGDFLSSLDEINEKVDEISKDIDFLVQGFSCGFGGGACISSPLNWAPLAPGNDPTLFGTPIGDGLRVDEGIPVFSALTGRQTYGNPQYCIPTVWPNSAKAYVPGPFCGRNSAGGSLGTWAPTNFVRLFVTPTITGAVGFAACYGGPAMTSGYSNPPGVHPLVPGGNCVVSAVPLIGCKDDGSDGDINSIGFPGVVGNGYGIINGNCDYSNNKDSLIKKPNYFKKDLVKEYLDYKDTGYRSSSLSGKFKEAFKKIAKGGNTYSGLTQNGPLISLDNGGDNDMEVSVSIDFSSVADGNFDDVIKIEKQRVSPFPDFLMDWTTRQIEEIVTKLTDFPTTFVVLPDFSGVSSYKWGDFPENLKNTYNKGKGDREKEERAIKKEIDSLKGQKKTYDCSGGDSFKCRQIDLDVKTLQTKKNFGGFKATSGIRSTYDFLSNIPLVEIEPETVNINIPWVEDKVIEKTILDWSLTKQQWSDEINRFKDPASFGRACNYENPEDQKACEDENSIREKAMLDADSLLRTLEKNIEIIESYKDTPEKISELINKKEDWLDQVLCNVEVISEITGGFITRNGKRFRSWVELYVLIKAILKSWQLLIDVFSDYDSECHECKNERNDLQYSIWKLIDLAIPKMPIIRFPKWPDIILDLHNIRAGLSINLPEFEFNKRPIILPSLPDLSLPDTPNANLNLPKLPLLPELEIPELPDLPSLPKVELPDLPPPPTLPKLFASLEVILDILKLVTKIMCIIKKSPFVPEWRAGDQIAFITERTGYLSIDFIDLFTPQFSFPFVDAIKVSTLVNLEFESEFIVELARQTLAPFKSFPNNIVNKLDIGISDIDLSDTTPQDIDVDIREDGSIDGDLGQNGSIDGFFLLVKVLAKKFSDAIVYIDETKDVRVSNKDFISLINESLNNPGFGENENLSQIRRVWSDVQNLTYSKENKIIKKLEENNREKFDTLKDIINTEIQKNKKLKEDINKIKNPELFIQVSNETKSDIDFYNNMLKQHNDRFILSLSNLVLGDDRPTKELKQEGKRLISRANGGLNQWESKANLSFNQSNTNISKLLSANTSDSSNASDQANSCSASNNSSHKYNYKGLYVIEGNKNYRLFDYLDELNGDEEISTINLDSDGDDDLIYMANSEVYLKENLKNKPTKNYINKPPIIINSNNNKFYKSLDFIESVNYFKETSVQNGYINLAFVKHKNNKINNYRIEFFEIVDKFSNIGNDSYIPSNFSKSIIDAFSDTLNITKSSDNSNYIIRNNLAYLSHVPLLSGTVLKTKQLYNISDDIKNNKVVNITSPTKVYSSGNRVTLKYYLDGDNTEKIAFIPEHSNIEFKQNVKIYSVRGDLFVASGKQITLEGNEIRKYLNKPIFGNSTIYFEGDYNKLTESSHIDISYYDGSDISLDFRDIKDYKLYDLGNLGNEYFSIRLDKKNDFYYAKIKAFSSNIIGTYSNQILLSPQKQADTNSPELGLSSVIKIPVYQAKQIDLTPYIYEDSGIRNIKDISIDFDLTRDSNSDGDTRNDIDTDKIKINKTLSSIKVEFGPYDNLFKKNIAFKLVDNNNNVGYREVPFQVYSPTPVISDYSFSTVKGYIDENLDNEPISLYRYRGGLIKKLENKVLTKNGNYTFEIKKDDSGLTLTNLGEEIAFINEYKGSIKLKNLGTKLKVYSSNHSLNNSIYPKIVLNFKGDDIYYQYLNFGKNYDLKIVNTFTDIEEEGIYINFTNKKDYNYYKTPLTVPYNPGTIVIYGNEDNGKEPLFIIFRDGRINTLNDSYKLKYGDYNDYIAFELIDNFNEEVARVLYKVDGLYIME